MIDNDKSQADDDAVKKELEGVPEEFLDNGEDEASEDGFEMALDALKADLETAKQDIKNPA